MSAATKAVTGIPGLISTSLPWRKNVKAPAPGMTLGAGQPGVAGAAFDEP